MLPTYMLIIIQPFFFLLLFNLPYFFFFLALIELLSMYTYIHILPIFFEKI